MKFAMGCAGLTGKQCCAQHAQWVETGWCLLLLQALEQHKGSGSASQAWKATGVKFADTFPSVSAPIIQCGTLLSRFHC